MTDSNDPDEIRADIERTRAELSDDVDALADTANPKNIAERQATRVKEAAVGVKEHVMGSASDATDTAAARLDDARQAVADRASAVGDAVSSAPTQVKQKARGNPLAAGVIAFGAGLLISGLIPSSEKEQRAVSTLQDKAEPLKEKATETVREVADNLREPAREAAQSIKDSAAEGVETVKEEGQAAKQDVQEQVQQSKENVQQSG
jgi:gas vesicle protein